MKQPLVSVITPLYNRVGLVGETIQSVIAQTYPHWEMVVVDDGSADGSYEYMQELAQRISLKLASDTRVKKRK